MGKQRNFSRPLHQLRGRDWEGVRGGSNVDVLLAPRFAGAPEQSKSDARRETDELIEKFLQRGGKITRKTHDRSARDSWLTIAAVSRLKQTAAHVYERPWNMGL